MTPKEKAEEIWMKFYNHGTRTGMDAKECAIICVDKIIQAVDVFGYENTMWDDYETGRIRTEGDPCEYWRKVKSELEKL